MRVWSRNGKSPIRGRALNSKFVGTLLALPIDGSVPLRAPKVKVSVAGLFQEAARLEREVWDGAERPEEPRVVAVHFSLDPCSNSIRVELPQTSSRARDFLTGARGFYLVPDGHCSSS